MEVVIQRSLDGTGQEKAPKNGLARRIILPAIAVDAIRQVPKTIGSPYQFHTIRGKRLTKGTLAYFWRSIRAGWVARGGRAIDLYELRHACATMLVERGLSVGDVAFQLGHQDGGRLGDDPVRASGRGRDPRPAQDGPLDGSTYAERAQEDVRMTCETDSVAGLRADRFGAIAPTVSTFSDVAQTPVTGLDVFRERLGFRCVGFVPEQPSQPRRVL
jgi:hypothetical protein